jgi:hypothetical protein
MVMNKTPVKETARQAGPHTPPRKTTYQINSTVPTPGCQNLVLTSSGWTAFGPYETDIISSSIEVDLVVSSDGTVPPTTRLVQGTVSHDSQKWYCNYAPGDFPQAGDVRMPAVLIVRAQTMQGGTVILYVPFCYDPSLPLPRR